MRQRSHFRNRRCLAKCRRRLGRAFALKPAEEASSSRSQSAAAVPDIDAPSRTVRPPFRLFDPFSARLGTRLWLGYPLGLSASALKAKLFGGYPSVSTQRLIKGSRSYLRRHGVQSRGAAISYHKLTLSVYRKFCRARKACRRTGQSPPPTPLRSLRSLRLKPLKETGHLVNVRGRTTNDKGHTMRDREIMVAVNTGSQTARGGSCCHARRRRRRSRRSCSASRQSGQSPSSCRPLQRSTSSQ